MHVLLDVLHVTCGNFCFVLRTFFDHQICKLFLVSYRLFFLSFDTNFLLIQYLSAKPLCVPDADNRKPVSYAVMKPFFWDQRGAGVTCSHLNPEVGCSIPAHSYAREWYYLQSGVSQLRIMINFVCFNYEITFNSITLEKKTDVPLLQ